MLFDTINAAKQVQEGSIIRLDFGCIYKGYCSGLARTSICKCDAKVGLPSPWLGKSEQWKDSV